MMTLPSTGETCILAYGVNWEFWGQLKSKKILDEGPSLILFQTILVLVGDWSLAMIVSCKTFL